jgi:hypothetical protein
MEKISIALDEPLGFPHFTLVVARALNMVKTPFETFQVETVDKGSGAGALASLQEGTASAAVVRSVDFLLWRQAQAQCRVASILFRGVAGMLVRDDGSIPDDCGVVGKRIGYPAGGTGMVERKVTRDFWEFCAGPDVAVPLVAITGDPIAALTSGIVDALPMACAASHYRRMKLSGVACRFVPVEQRLSGAELNDKVLCVRDDATGSWIQTLLRGLQDAVYLLHTDPDEAIRAWNLAMKPHTNAAYSEVLHGVLRAVPVRTRPCVEDLRPIRNWLAFGGMVDPTLDLASALWVDDSVVDPSAR